MQSNKTTPLRSIWLWSLAAALAAGGAGFTGCSAAQDRFEERSEDRSKVRSKEWSGDRSEDRSWGWGEGGSEGRSEEWAAGPAEKVEHEGTPPRPMRTEPDGETPRPVREKTARADPGIVTVRVDVGNRPLGAYELALRYDPEAVSVTRVLPPRYGGFPAFPMADPSTFQSGATPLLGFHVGGSFPSGTVVVAVIRFQAKRPGVHAVSVSVKALYSPEGKPIPGTARVSPQSVHSR